MKHIILNLLAAAIFSSCSSGLHKIKILTETKEQKQILNSDKEFLKSTKLDQKFSSLGCVLNYS